MARKVNQELRETWRQRIERQRRSGLTVAEFSRQEGVSTASFYRWQQEVGAVPAAPAKPYGTSSTGQDDCPHGQNGISRTHGRHVSCNCRWPLTSSNPWIELMLTDGTLIRLPQQNLAALQTVLQACDGAPRVPGPGSDTACLTCLPPSASLSTRNRLTCGNILMGCTRWSRRR